MKLPETLKPSNLLRKDKKGVALVTVLTVMALTTILVLTFFSLATSEHRASNTYSHGLQAQQVAEQAVNMVIAQIREATTVGTTKAWASQPGAVRQWDEAGNPDFAYKLYSDDRMKTLDWSEFQTDFLDAGGWSDRTAHFVDLNEPVIRGEKVYYPIVHPAASTVPQWPKPLGNDKDGVEGFTYNEGSMKLVDEGRVGELAARIAKADGHVAMPVRWIYQLADGTLGVLNDSASGSGSTEAYSFRTIAGQGTPSETNPMVARFAFWADDETSKLNVNTHAGGLAWDTPKTGGELDMSMGKYQPAQKEWQRYPGHPASTHLSPALAPGVLDIVNDRDAMEMLYRLVPRIVGGGSESGTRIIDTRRKEEENGLVADREPLFPTLDDVIMRSDREPHEFPDAQGQAIKEEELSDYLERSKFFVTANSRAPETNLFNLPRVAIWPIYNADSGDKEKYNQYLTPFDQLIHYCASMGESPGGAYPRYEYIFKRENADSTDYDYEYITRNKELYAYLLDLLERPIPGYGDSFSSKYAGGEHKQILTQIFDYIRTINLHDDTLYREDFAKAFKSVNSPEHLTYTNSRDNLNKSIGLKGHGQVVPIKIDETKGFGRFYTVSGVQVQVISCAEPDDTGMPTHFGASSYRNRRNIAVSNASTYRNFPPLPANFEGGLRTSAEHEPAWLRSLRENSPTLYQEALKPENWNWQLAYLDQGYFDRVVGANHKTKRSGGDPALHKFNRATLTPSGPASPFTLEKTRLKNDEQLVQGTLLFNLFTPSIGWNSINPDMEIEIEIAQNDQFRFITGNAEATPADLIYGGAGVPFIGFDMFPQNKWTFATNQVDSAWGGRRYGGTMPFEYLLAVPNNFTTFLFREINKQAIPDPLKFTNQQISHNRDVSGGRSRLTWTDRGYDLIPEVLKAMKVTGDVNKLANAYRYDLVTVPFKIRGASKDAQNRYWPAEINFTGGDVTFRFYHGGERSENSSPQGPGGIGAKGVDGGELIQEVEIEVPPFKHNSIKMANPLSRRPMIYDVNMAATYQEQHGGNFNEFDALDKDTFSFLERNNLGADPSNLSVRPANKISITHGTTRNPTATGRFAQISVHGRPSPFGIGDVVKSVELSHGDARIAAGRSVIEKREVFQEHRYYKTKSLAHSQTNAVGGGYYGAAIEKEYLVIPTLPGNSPYNGKAPIPFGVEKSKDVQLYGDFDNGAGLMIDGPYINKPDEGNTHSLKTKFVREITDVWERSRNFGEFPYFNREDLHEAGGPAYFSPNRLVSGPGMFGSLPTGVLTNKPWRTLLFRPELESGTAPGVLRHPGGANPPDHLIMDLFWMPVVEPYAISEPLSTAGKVNMNFQIVPFLHVDRSTALRGVFRSEFILCVPNRWHVDYKHNYGRGTGYHWRDNPYGGALQGKRLRAAIREDDTLEQFTERFDDGAEIFKSSSAICEIHLVPEEVSSRLNTGSRGSVGSYTPTVAEMDNGKYWRDHALIGDNSRERPYTNIQTRLTTKSNTFLVHYRAQVIKQARRDDSGGYAEWRPGTDSVQAEYRGSSLVERYVNPDATDIPDFASGSIDGLDKFYRYRVVNPRRFAP
jgi:hypothetical protein